MSGCLWFPIIPIRYLLRLILVFIWLLSSIITISSYSLLRLRSPYIPDYRDSYFNHWYLNITTCFKSTESFNKVFKWNSNHKTLLRHIYIPIYFYFTRPFSNLWVTPQTWTNTRRTLILRRSSVPLPLSGSLLTTYLTPPSDANLQVPLPSNVFSVFFFLSLLLQYSYYGNR